MKLMNKILIAAAGIMMATTLSAMADVTIVDRPAAGTSSNYTSFKAPLQQTPLMKLPVGSIKPEGWLLEYLNRQKEGLCGQLGTVSAWLDNHNNQWLSDGGDHGWEEVPYWLRGYCSLAYVLGDKDMIDEAQTWFEGVFANLKPDGFLGPRNYENGRPEIWAQMIMLWALQTYYEYSQDPRVLTAMKDYYMWELNLADNLLLEGYWEHLRGGDNIWSVEWLYNRTGDPDLLPVIEKLHKNTADWTLKGDLPNWHGVNVAQGFREPAMYWLYKGDPELLTQAYDNLAEMRLRYGQVPGGMYGADENARTGYFDPRQGTETCALVEQMASDEIMMEITGDGFWADHCEQVALNDFTAALMPDMRSLRYLTAPNMAISDEKLHGPSIDNNLRGMLSMSPFSSRCCQHNHGMGWPYYAERLVMATADNGLATMLYAQNKATAKVADGKTVTLSQTTGYPFDGAVSLTLSTDMPVDFPLYLRVPSWAKSVDLTVNGDKNSYDNVAGKYIRVNRTWNNGDKVEVTFPMELTTETWELNKGSVSVNYGPLTMSLLIQENYEQHDSRDHEFVQDDSHWQAGVDASLWPCYTIKPASDWNYALAVDEQLNLITDGVFAKTKLSEFPFTLEGCPIFVSARGYKIPAWGYDETGMTDVLPVKYDDQDTEATPITLVPMGCARLRISAFPRHVEK